jgi:uncharacterized membrane protein
MLMLIAAAAAFLAIHLLAGTRLRDRITGAIGEGPFMGMFSLLSVAALVWLGFAYAHARGGAENVAYWTATPATMWIQLALTLLAFLLLVPGLMTPNPTSVRQEGAVEAPVKGIVRVTRHPFLWGVALWAAGHLMVNGDRASLVLFGSLLILAVLGTYSIDGKRRRKLGDKWDAFARQTSDVPFAAILQGRQTLSLGEIGAVKLGAAVAIWAALVFAHPWLFGASPLPGR